MWLTSLVHLDVYFGVIDPRKYLDPISSTAFSLDQVDSRVIVSVIQSSELRSCTLAHFASGKERVDLAEDFGEGERSWVNARVVGGPNPRWCGQFNVRCR